MTFARLFDPCWILVSRRRGRNWARIQVREPFRPHCVQRYRRRNGGRSRDTRVFSPGRNETRGEPAVRTRVVADFAGVSGPRRNLVADQAQTGGRRLGDDGVAWFRRTLYTDH